MKTRKEILCRAATAAALIATRYHDACMAGMNEDCSHTRDSLECGRRSTLARGLFWRLKAEAETL